MYEATMPRISDELLLKQKEAFGEIFQRIYRLAGQVAAELPCDSPGKPEHGQPQPGGPSVEDARQIHRVFAIDGGRGSGKTTLLLTLAQALECAGRDRSGCCPSGAVPEDATTPHGPRRFRTAWVLPTICPNDLEGSDTVMEAIFAHLNARLDEWHREEHETDRREKTEDLKRRLVEDIQRGWAFSRQTGWEVVARDAMDYRDFVQLRAAQLSASHRRLEAWRGFVSDLLNHVGAVFLVVPVDDADLARISCRETLDAIRIYLAHPRIITLFCADLTALRRRLAAEALAEVAPAVNVLHSDGKEESNPLALELLKLAREEPEDLVEKVLPLRYRYRTGLGEGDLDRLVHHRRGDEIVSFSELLWGLAENKGEHRLRLMAWRVLRLLSLVETRLSVRSAAALVGVLNELAATPARAIRAMEGIILEQARLSPRFVNVESGPDPAQAWLDRGLLDIAWKDEGRRRIRPTFLLGRSRERFAPETALVAFWAIVNALDGESLRLRKAAGESEDISKMASAALSPLLPPLQSVGYLSHFLVGLRPMHGISTLFPPASAPRNCLLFSDVVVMAPVLLEGKPAPLPKLLASSWPALDDGRMPKEVVVALANTGWNGSARDVPASLAQLAAAFRSSLRRKEHVEESAIKRLRDAIVGGAVVRITGILHDLARGNEGSTGRRELGRWVKRELEPSLGEAAAATLNPLRDLLIREHYERTAVLRLVRAAMAGAEPGRPAPAGASPRTCANVFARLLDPGAGPAHTVRAANALRARVLLAWSLEPLLEHWVASGLGSSEDWKRLAGQLGRVIRDVPDRKRRSAHERRAALERALPDFTEEEISELGKSLRAMSKRLNKLLEDEASLEVPQIKRSQVPNDPAVLAGFLLGMTPLRAKELLDALRNELRS